MIVNMPSNDDSTFGDLPRRKGTKVVLCSFFFFQIKKFQKLLIPITRQPISKFIINVYNILQSWKVFWKILEYLYMEDLRFIHGRS